MDNETIGKLKKYGVFLMVMFSLWGCKQIRKVTDIIVQPTARELYAREFQGIDTIRLNAWQTEFQKAKNDSLSINLPYVETGSFFKNRNLVYSYQAALEEGSMLRISAKNEVLVVRSFLDVYKRNKDSTYTLIKENAVGENELEFLIEESGIYTLFIQPEIGATGEFEHQIITLPSFAFPVVGKDNSAIQSYWGAVRDGGARSHEGVDIFATRGTPVIAVTEGRVSATGNKGLGGKQVWLRTGIFGKSLYYAHLDTVLTRTGTKVSVGDTLGLVGNTGNARTTAPHLHFGIYESGRGAINPLPFIKRADIPRGQDIDSIAPNGQVTAAVANLRNAPTLKSVIIGEASKNDTLTVLGITEQWAHIETKNGIKAFIHRNLIAAP